MIKSENPKIQKSWYNRTAQWNNMLMKREKKHMFIFCNILLHTHFKLTA